MKIKKNDKVRIMAGKDKGREGVVEKVLPKKGKVIVVGVNISKKHARSRGNKGRGGIIDITVPLSMANVALLCPKCGRLTRVEYQQDKNEEKVRICKKCREVI